MDLTDFLRRAGGHHFTAFVAAFGAEVDDIVRGLHHVQVVLDDYHGISLVHQFFQHNQKFADVFAVKAGGGFVQDVERVSAAAAHELGSQLHALGFAAGHGGSGLA